jgi:hypothetical protein
MMTIAPDTAQLTHAADGEGGMIGRRMREILDILQDFEGWHSGELYNDGGMWTASGVDAEGVRYSRRVNARSAQRLHDSGYVMYKEVREKMGLFGADRVVFVLTSKGERV